MIDIRKEQNAVLRMADPDGKPIRAVHGSVTAAYDITKLFQIYARAGNTIFRKGLFYKKQRFLYLRKLLHSSELYKSSLLNKRKHLFFLFFKKRLHALRHLWLRIWCTDNGAREFHVLI